MSEIDAEIIPLIDEGYRVITDIEDRGNGPLTRYIKIINPDGSCPISWLVDETYDEDIDTFLERIDSLRGRLHELSKKKKRPQT